jgi:hypothetical protein
MDDILKVANEGLKPVFDAGSRTAQAATRDISPKIYPLLSGASGR